MERSERRGDEIEAVQSYLSAEDGCIRVESEDEGGWITASLSLPTKLRGQRVEVRIRMPPKYPGHACLEVSQVACNCSRDEERELHRAAEAACGDDESVLSVADAVESEISRIERSQQCGKGQQEGTAPSSSSLGRAVMKRAACWSHHIVNEKKRRTIFSWAGKLEIAGFLKPGYPGIIIVEGPKEGLDEFLRRLKTLRWKAFQVRPEPFPALSSF